MKCLLSSSGHGFLFFFFMFLSTNKVFVPNRKTSKLFLMGSQESGGLRGKGREGGGREGGGKKVAKTHCKHKH